MTKIFLIVLATFPFFSFSQGNEGTVHEISPGSSLVLFKGSSNETTVTCTGKPTTNVCRCRQFRRYVHSRSAWPIDLMLNVNGNWEILDTRSARGYGYHDFAYSKCDEMKEKHPECTQFLEKEWVEN